MLTMATLCAWSGGLLVGLWMMSNVLEVDLHGGPERFVLVSLRVSVEPGDPIGPGWVEDFVVDITRLGGRSVLSTSSRTWSMLPR
jgi:hypothetical protein